MTIGLLP